MTVLLILHTGIQYAAMGYCYIKKTVMKKCNKKSQDVTKRKD